MTANRDWVLCKFRMPKDYVNVLLLLRDGDMQVGRVEWVEILDENEEPAGRDWMWEGTAGDGGDLNDLTNPVVYWCPLPGLPFGFRKRKKPEWRPKMGRKRAAAGA